MKRILILGKRSYLGKSLWNWLNQFPEKYQTKIVSTKEYEWKKTDFSAFDTVVDFAGIAHLNHTTEDMRELFYAINRDLTVEMGKYAKEHGIRQFVYFSSMNVYGDYCNGISDKERVDPGNFYGDSKLQGDIGLHQLEAETFKVASIRPPFVYGKGCTGNYNTISKIAKRTPFFPDYRNKKSMIYIDNLCEFVRMVIDRELSGIFTPQNRELVSTSDLVREIAKQNGRRIAFTGILNKPVFWGTKINRNFRKAFSNDYYTLKISDDFDFQYCVVGFEESVKRTECR